MYRKHVPEVCLVVKILLVNGLNVLRGRSAKCPIIEFDHNLLPLKDEIIVIQKIIYGKLIDFVRK